jgi:F-box/WD-40 domain protein 5
LDPPPIAQEIDIHVIDLATLTQVGMMRRAHRAYTPNEECFFIFLDACDMYLASGSEDKHGYLWDRHYGVSLAKLPHTDVCNSVAFNPADSRMLVSVSDDGTIKIWRSKDQCREFSIDMESKNKGTTLYLKQRRSSCTSAVSCTS